MALTAEMVGEELALGGFTGAVEAFEGNKCASRLYHARCTRRPRLQVFALVNTDAPNAGRRDLKTAGLR